MSVNCFPSTGAPATILTNIAMSLPLVIVTSAHTLPALEFANWAHWYLSRLHHAPPSLEYHYGGMLTMITSPFSARGLREHRLFESVDLDETCELISSVMQPHLLVPSGAKAGLSHIDFVRLGEVGIGTIAFGNAMRVVVEAVDGYHLLMFFLTGQAKVRTRGKTVCVDQSNAVQCAAGDPFDAVLSHRPFFHDR